MGWGKKSKKQHEKYEQKLHKKIRRKNMAGDVFPTLSGETNCMFHLNTGVRVYIWSYHCVETSGRCVGGLPCAADASADQRGGVPMGKGRPR